MRLLEKTLTVILLVLKLKVNEYLLDELYKASEYVEYTITINLIKEDNKWVVEDLDTITKEKLHGTYNYENDNK